jgi:hypothetical protein
MLSCVEWLDPSQAKVRDLAAHVRASFAWMCCPLNSEGAGNAGRSMRPQPRMQNKKAYERSHHGHTGSPGIPYAMVLTGSFVISSVTGLFATVAGGVASTNLTPASGRQDHTTSPSASAPFVSRAGTSTASRAQRP